jgi:hypothetical protein
MKLSKFDLCAGWEDAAYPFPHTLAEAMFPGVEFAIVHADAGTESMPAPSRRRWPGDCPKAGTSTLPPGPGSRATL